MPAGFGYASQPEEVTWQQRLADAVANAGGLRNLSRLTGVAYTTLQNLASGQTRTPRASTVERLTGALADAPTFRVERGRTWADDRALWTGDSLADLTPPQGSQFFKLVVWSPNTPSRAASSDWFDYRDLSPLDAADAIGADPSVIRRVIWDRAR